MAKKRKPKPRKGTDSAASPPSSVPPPSNLPESDPQKEPFTPRTLDRTIIAMPLLEKVRDAKPEDEFDIIIDVNLEYSGGRSAARYTLWEWIDALPGVLRSHPQPAGQASSRTEQSASGKGKRQGIDGTKSKYSQQYLFGRLSAANIQTLVRQSERSREEKRTSDGKLSKSPLYRIWQDDEVRPFTNLSISTVKADAARNAFGTSGKDIVWAVLDTGIDAEHPHFAEHENLNLSDPVAHRDFTMGSASDAELAASARLDTKGHGTHVAGIIAGEFRAEKGKKKIVATVQRRNETGSVVPDRVTDIPVMSGMAPQCKLLSLKVLDDSGKGLASNMIAAIEYIQELNGGGRRIRVHGVNMSVGYDFEPKWFACGQSPLCVEVDRLVRSGVIVVVAAGNTGYGYNQSLALGAVPAGQDVTINDPGNAELAITVGSTHREMPHIYGVSYFSSKGPTGDGRLKPDLVAPGEKIISCRSGYTGSANLASGSAAPAAEASQLADPSQAADVTAYYKEDSGTSMAAPHVSGIIAAFLSVRREFIGKPEAVKEIFMSTATDLKRAVYFQGRGLVDLMRAIQSV
ncbi:S8 family peptidase [Bradyrhizobium barranii subsp. barranii]|uniref:S8 family peptidase n=1 Tax=Bradyrhizobium barranii subsp. barranii TaxID=2823807 RepID=A0A939M161_9BRAD|nr:S8 family peptidase [Bradyrhizobium barranii]UEM12387.1 S8 family peptidase [Bradyrhizobium barranii subsp. barranii]